MNRAILESCFPFLIALVVSFVLLHLVARLSGAKWDFSRLRRLHQCQDGGVQAFSFVAALPAFILIVAFIVQVSQLMIGMIGVHYSAYAGARAASVWLPAEVPYIEPVNKVLDSVAYDAFLYPEYQPTTDRLNVVMGPSSLPNSGKYRRIWTASIMGVAPFCTSFDKQLQIGEKWPTVMQTLDSATSLYSLMMPSADAGRVRIRLERKLAWAEHNTMVFVEWSDLHANDGRHTRRGPTYNSFDHPSYNAYPYEGNEIGWQDPVTVHVYHRFALMPGPGKLLADLINWDWNNDNADQAAGGSGLPRLPARHSNSIVVDPGIASRFMNQQANTSDTYTVVLHASATMNNDGLIPLYREQQYDF